MAQKEHLKKTKRSKISKTKEAIHAYPINLYQHNFFELILFLNPLLLALCEVKQDMQLLHNMYINCHSFVATSCSINLVV